MAMPPEHRALSNQQREEIYKKRLEPGQATMTLSEFGKLFPDDGWLVPQLSRTDSVNGTAEEQPIA